MTLSTLAAVNIGFDAKKRLLSKFLLSNRFSMLQPTYFNQALKITALALSSAFLFSSMALAVETDKPQDTAIDLDAFPAPKANYERHTIRLPIGNYENNLKIELLAGKVQEVDCNATHYTGLLTEKTLEGWGYNYYELSDLTGPISTKMACPDEDKSLQFVPVLSSGSLLQYNSRLPVVVYLPEGLELRWRIWVATPYNTAIMD